ncbi:MAG: Ppx/GppA family phosphatase, partial [Phycisphaeraceae bacterium]|nr:Ppx/GppA family phosphatase [Phycisphaeraceae bacterium]
IDERAMEQAAYTVARMKRIADGYGAAHIRGVATCAVREASNGSRLVELVERWAGLKIEVINGEEEAWLAFRSVAHAFDLSMFSSAVVDVGGGSTEIVLSSAGAVERVLSLPIGAVRLTERFGGARAASGPRFKALRRYVRELLAERMGAEPFAPQLVIGTGGTTTSLAAIAMNREKRRSPHAPPPSAVQGYELKRSDVRRMLEELRALDLERRARVPGLSPDRADIIVPGVAILLEIMRHLEAPRLRAHDGGIRDGLLLTMVQEIFPGERPAQRAGDPVAAARRFAAACRTDERHGAHVARLALSMFDQLAAVEHDAGGDAAWARPQHRVVLETACHLLDVGYVINYTKHHVHSYNLIRHSELPGLSPGQVELAAQIARYHRAAEPRSGHEQFAALDEADRELVRRLAAIVRLAVGLDRTHTQAISAVRITARGRAARFVLEAAENPSVDIWGAERKAKMFRSVFGLEPQFVWVPPGARTLGAGAPAPAGGTLNGTHRPAGAKGRRGRGGRAAAG